MAEQRSTLVKPPPLDSTKAQIENALELTDLSIIGPVSSSPSCNRDYLRGVSFIKPGLLILYGQDMFTNTRELWHPPGARGIYGGAVIAQTLAVS